MDNFENIFKTICRICLSYGNSENIVCLTDNNEDDGLSFYGKAVLSLTSISVKTECLPDNMCAKCCSVLEQAIMFKRTCENSNEKLTKFMHNLDSLDTQTPDFKEKLCEYVLFMDRKNIRTDNFSKKILPIISEVSCSYLNTNEHETKDEIKTEVKIEYHSDVDFDDSKNFEDDSWHDIYKEKNEISDNQRDIKQEQDLKSHRSYEKPKKEAIKKKLLQYNYHSGTESDKNINTEYRPGDKLHTINKQQKKTTSLGKGKKLKKKEVINIKPGPDAGNKKDKEYSPQKKSTYVQCEICMKTVTEFYLPIHIRRCHKGDDEKNFICDLCGKKFFALRDLQHHIAGVHGITPFICKVCGYKARSADRLKTHNRIHTGERPYKCQKCGLTFIRPNALNRHSKLHMEKTVQCPYPNCTKKYHIREYMLGHFNGSHHKLYMYACNQCDVRYASKLSVINHLTKVHGIPRKEHGRIRKIDLVIPPEIKKILGKK